MYMEMEKGLAVVTGASRGIGAAVAEGLARDGYRVALIARNRAGLERVCAGIAEGVRPLREPVAVPLDITDCAGTDGELRRLDGLYGGIEVLVNAAGVFVDGSLEEPVERFREILEVNVVAQYGILKTVTELMKVRRRGYIFNVASRAAVYGFPGGGAYGASKFAFAGLTESLYRELSPLGVRLTSLCPGWVNTDMAREAGTPLRDDEMIQPDDLWQTIRYLLSLSENVCVKEVVLEMRKSLL
jgi:NAD(P)-dependent dehydrogenase (short-subunit alcohol dehydrogenase family)